MLNQNQILSFLRKYKEDHLEEYGIESKGVR
jgi:hypothetical protein